MIDEIVFEPWFWNRLWPIVISAGKLEDMILGFELLGDFIDDFMVDDGGVGGVEKRPEGIVEKRQCLFSTESKSKSDSVPISYRPSFSLSIIKIPWIWLGIITNASKEINGKWSGISHQNWCTSKPIADNSIVLSIILPKQCSWSLVQIVIK